MNDTNFISPMPYRAGRENKVVDALWRQHEKGTLQAMSLPQYSICGEIHHLYNPDVALQDLIDKCSRDPSLTPG